MEWAEYLMGFAEHAARKSKDSTKVGAVLVDSDGTVLLNAYNGIPRGVSDLTVRYERPAKYLWCQHSERNLISFAARHGIKTLGLSVFCTHHPCSQCAGALIQAGIGKVVVGTGTTSMPDEEFEAAATMFREAGVKVVTV